MLKARGQTPFFDVFIVFTVQWMMPLFFIISGTSAYYALSHQSWPQYLTSRVKRLLVPLLFGIFVVIAPWQVYLERISRNQYSGPFWQWYWHDYFRGWFGFGGNFAWMGVHLWYLEFLFVFSVITLPLFLHFRSPSGVRMSSALSRFLSKPGAIFLLAIPIIVCGFISKIPSIEKTILGEEGFGGWSILPYLAMFLIGYLLASNNDFTNAMERHRIVGLLMGIGLFFLGLILYMATKQWSSLTRMLVMIPLRSVLCWSCLITFFGFASRHLRFSNGFLKYANEAVLPFYILHQTIILTIGYYIIRLDTNLFVEYLIILFISFAAIIVIYELLIRRSNFLRILFGMKKLPSAKPVRIPQI